MLYPLIVLFSIGLGIASFAVFVLLVTSIHREDRYRTLGGEPRSILSSGTRRILGFNVDHTRCLTHPEVACPTCSELDRTVGV